MSLVYALLFSWSCINFLESGICILGSAAAIVAPKLTSRLTDTLHKSTLEAIRVLKTFDESDTPVPSRQELATMKFDFQAACASKSGLDAEGRDWSFTFRRVECLPSANRCLVRLYCNAKYRALHPRPHTVITRSVKFFAECPPFTSCQPIHLLAPNGQAPREEIGCVDDEDLEVDTVSAESSRAHPGLQNIHCGAPRQIPGPHYIVVAGQKTTDVVLTEQVLYPNGSAYPAPILFIRDTTNPFTFDRVFRRKASVASAQIEINQVKGKFQTRTFEFCMQLLPNTIANSAIFMYSLIKTSRAANRRPAHLKSISLVTNSSRTV